MGSFSRTLIPGYATLEADFSDGTINNSRPINELSVRVNAPYS